ncbi:MAG: hypothetical protein F6J89_15970 [Symploca sp. SIO1C4]|uniref:Uncharacterized protein n=1 Tax=Symploca sp. SIO1C4 TaxID=2607765 RepID=A0A6B3NGE3_9CYAN|nr:hypothetical protein [Symploca sp. SIO1C4]
MAVKPRRLGTLSTRQVLKLAKFLGVSCSGKTSTINLVDEILKSQRLKYAKNYVVRDILDGNN